MSAEQPERLDARREALLLAAAEVFFARGYSDTSIDAIIDRAGGSKRNIYNEFGNKEGLFLAIVERNASDAISILEMKDVVGSDLTQTLTAFGGRLLDVYMSPTVLAIYRIAIVEAKRFPDLVKTFYELGPGRTTIRLAQILEQAQKRGEIRMGDCLQLAGHFVGMIRDNLHLQVVLGLRPPPSRDEAQNAVSSAVSVFLNGVRAGRK